MMESYTMSVNFSGETTVCNWLHDFLVSNDYDIVQLICPGAQATLSIRYDSPKTNKKKIVYPDLITLTSNRIVLGEIKEGYSKEDKFKLLDIKNSVNGVEKIKSLVSRITKKELSSFEVQFILIHCDVNAKPDEQMNQLILTNESSKII